LGDEQQASSWPQFTDTVSPHQHEQQQHNRLSLNPDKINITTFIANNSPQPALNIGYNGKHTEESGHTKSLVCQIDNYLNLTNHIFKVIPMSYFAYFQFIMKYGKIVWGNSSNSRRYSLYKRKLLD
jgi:hypothetical protein